MATKHHHQNHHDIIWKVAGIKPTTICTRKKEDLSRSTQTKKLWKMRFCYKFAKQKLYQFSFILTISCQLISVKSAPCLYSCNSIKAKQSEWIRFKAIIYALTFKLIILTAFVNVNRNFWEILFSSFAWQGKHQLANKIATFVERWQHRWWTEWQKYKLNQDLLIKFLVKVRKLIFWTLHYFMIVDSFECKRMKQRL